MINQVSLQATNHVVITSVPIAAPNWIATCLSRLTLQHWLQFHEFGAICLSEPSSWIIALLVRLVNSIFPHWKPFNRTCMFWQIIFQIIYLTSIFFYYNKRFISAQVSSEWLLKAWNEFVIHCLLPFVSQFSEVSSKGVKDTQTSSWMRYLVWIKAEWLTLYVNELFGHPEVPRVEGLIVGDVALSLWDRNHHVVPLLPVHLLSRDGPLEMVFLTCTHRK